MKIFVKILLKSLKKSSIKVHIHWASHARDLWSHTRLYSFLGKQQSGTYKYTVFFHHIVIVSDKNYHNMVKKYCILIYNTLLVTWKTVKPYMRSQILCMRCSVYVNFYKLKEKLNEWLDEKFNDRRQTPQFPEWFLTTKEEEIFLHFIARLIIALKACATFIAHSIIACFIP